MNLIKRTLILVTLFLLTACPDSSNTGSLLGTEPAPANKASSVTTCSGGTIPIPNPSDFFPLNPNSRWVYKGTATLTMAPNIPYTNEVNVVGSQDINGTQTSIITATNYLAQGFDRSYVHMDTTKGSTEWSIVLDNTATTPLNTAVFPISIGKKCTQTYSNVDFGPIDPYSANSPHVFGTYNIDVTFAAVEPLTVIAGTFADTIRTEITQTITASATVDGNTININSNNSTTEWMARNVGVIKTVYNSSSASRNMQLRNLLTTLSLLRKHQHASQEMQS